TDLQAPRVEGAPEIPESRDAERFSQRALEPVVFEAPPQERTNAIDGVRVDTRLGPAFQIRFRETRRDGVDVTPPQKTAYRIEGLRRLDRGVDPVLGDHLRLPPAPPLEHHLADSGEVERMDRELAGGRRVAVAILFPRRVGDSDRVEDLLLHVVVEC